MKINMIEQVNIIEEANKQAELEKQARDALHWEALAKDLERENDELKKENDRLRSQLSKMRELANIARQCLRDDEKEDEYYRTEWFTHAENLLDLIKDLY